VKTCVAVSRAGEGVSRSGGDRAGFREEPAFREYCAVLRSILKTGGRAP
jgi:hypothetical protein